MFASANQNGVVYAVDSTTACSCRIGGWEKSENAGARCKAQVRPGNGRGGVVKNPTGRRILVVDDNEEAGESLAMLLRLFGHEVRVVLDGESALAESCALSPDVVLLDISLPGGMNGFEVARQLRVRRGDTLRLVALTGWADAEARRRGEEVGFDHYLAKPASTEELKRAVEGRAD
jgi:CheY-like chemotaxis protein